VDTPHRLLTWGTIGVGEDWQVLPMLEIRSGFPFSAVDENQDLVGVRNRAGRYPVLASLDLAVQRRVEFRGRRVWLGIRVFNVFDRRNYRDVQSNVDAATYGQFFNPAERSFHLNLYASLPRRNSNPMSSLSKAYLTACPMRTVPTLSRSHAGSTPPW
jgi:hypothetical protein